MRHSNTQQLSTKNKKLFQLKKFKTLTCDVPFNSATVPVINLSGFNLNLKDLKYGLHHCFIDKSRLVRRNIETELKYLSHTAEKDISSEDLKHFHEYLRKMTNKFTQNICHARDNTYHDLRHLRNNKDIVLLSGDKDSSAVVINKVYYVKNVNGMINEGIQQGKYEIITDTTHEDLEKFQNFLYHNFKSHPRYNNMRPVSYQPARFFKTAKTHKFDGYSSINANNLKLRSIIDQWNTFTYSATKIVSDYLQPIAQNEYVIKDTLLFAEMIKYDILDPEEEYVSYDVESLFTSIPVSETIDYIIKEIYENKVIKPMCKSKLIFRRPLEKLTKNCVFSVNDTLVEKTRDVLSVVLFLLSCLVFK